MRTAGRRRPFRALARGTSLATVLGVFAGAVLTLMSAAPVAETFGSWPGREHSGITVPRWAARKAVRAVTTASTPDR